MTPERREKLNRFISATRSDQTQVENAVIAQVRGAFQTLFGITEERLRRLIDEIDAEATELRIRALDVRLSDADLDDMLSLVEHPAFSRIAIVNSDAFAASASDLMALGQRKMQDVLLEVAGDGAKSLVAELERLSAVAEEEEDDPDPNGNDCQDCTGCPEAELCFPDRKRDDFDA